MLLSVVIPFYNEKDTIREIVKKVLSLKCVYEVVAVDDGSTDNSSSVLHSFSDSRINLYALPQNQGKAAALRLGIKKASGEYILFQDADLEYDPADYDKLLKPVLRGSGSIVYGNRFPLGRKNMFFTQKTANKCLTLLTNFLYGGKVKDMETCYKLVPRDTLRLMDLREEGFAIEAEITAKLLKSGHKIVNVPVSYKGRSYRQGKKIKFFDALIAVLVLFKYRFFN